MPDHGHLMHLFLIREPGMDRFYHLHPQIVLPEPGLHPHHEPSFETDLPAIPAGRYQVFADVVRESGFPDTMIAEIDLPDVPGVALTGDNSAAASSPLPADGARANGNTDPSSASGPNGAVAATVNVTPDGTTAILPDGYKMIWERGTAPFTANHFVWLRFRLETPDGKPVSDSEPYMGMAGHAEIVNSDRSVFAHIHPDGSVAMAALELAQKNSSQGNGGANAQSRANPANDMAGMDMSMDPRSAEVSFPYGFPRAGEYRLFVQMKRGGTIETGVFDTQVLP
jgi:hypothetical protein